MGMVLWYLADLAEAEVDALLDRLRGVASHEEAVGAAVLEQERHLRLPLRSPPQCSSSTSRRGPAHHTDVRTVAPLGSVRPVPHKQHSCASFHSARNTIGGQRFDLGCTCVRSCASSTYTL